MGAVVTFAPAAAATAPQHCTILPYRTSVAAMVEASLCLPTTLTSCLSMVVVVAPMYFAFARVGFVGIACSLLLCCCRRRCRCGRQNRQHHRLCRSRRHHHRLRLFVACRFFTAFSLVWLAALLPVWILFCC